jgi:hypothetical protein
MFKNIISYSIWGDNPKYLVGALRNLEVNQVLLPNYISRFYIGSSTHQRYIDPLIESEKTEVIIVDENNSYEGLFWRFFAADDPDVNIMLSRDTDSRISKREVAAIQEWLSSEKDFHIMRDHPYHTTSIMGGMWGCRNKILSGIKIWIEDWKKEGRNSRSSSMGIDQDFLSDVIYPKIIDNCLEHSEFGLGYGNITKSFPTERIDYEFVGDVFDENNVRHPDHWKIIQKYTGNK